MLSMRGGGYFIPGLLFCLVAKRPLPLSIAQAGSFP